MKTNVKSIEYGKLFPVGVMVFDWLMTETVMNLPRSLESF